MSTIIQIASELIYMYAYICICVCVINTCLPWFLLQRTVLIEVVLHV